MTLHPVNHFGHQCISTLVWHFLKNLPSVVWTWRSWTFVCVLEYVSIMCMSLGSAAVIRMELLNGKFRVGVWGPLSCRKEAITTSYIVMWGYFEEKKQTDLMEYASLVVSSPPCLRLGIRLAHRCWSLLGVQSLSICFLFLVSQCFKGKVIGTSCQWIKNWSVVTSKGEFGGSSC